MHVWIVPTMSTGISYFRANLSHVSFSVGSHPQKKGLSPDLFCRRVKGEEPNFTLNSSATVLRHTSCRECLLLAGSGLCSLVLIQLIPSYSAAPPLEVEGLLCKVFHLCLRLFPLQQGPFLQGPQVPEWYKLPCPAVM